MSLLQNILEDSYIDCIVYPLNMGVATNSRFSRLKKKDDKQYDA